MRLRRLHKGLVVERFPDVMIHELGLDVHEQRVHHMGLLGEHRMGYGLPEEHHRPQGVDTALVGVH